MASLVFLSRANVEQDDIAYFHAFHKRIGRNLRERVPLGAVGIQGTIHLGELLFGDGA